MNELARRRSDPTPELISRARSLLAEAKTLDQVLHVRGIASGATKFFKAAGHSRKLAQEAAEVRLRAERKAGEILREMEETGQRAGRGGDRAKSQTVTLPDLGVEKMQSSRWQAIAQVPEPVFESYIRERKERETDELTTSGLINIAKLETRRALAEEIRKQPLPMPHGPFSVVVIDPPWRYGFRNEDGSHRSRNPYPDMTMEEILALPVSARLAADAIVWLWTTNSFMREAFQCLDQWGVEQKTILTWVKNQMGTGDWLRGQTEHCLLAVRGRPLVTLTNQTTALIADRTEHSAKPDEFYALVESLCPGSKLEMFARVKREGWCSWGAEAP